MVSCIEILKGLHYGVITFINDRLCDTVEFRQVEGIFTVLICCNNLIKSVQFTHCLSTYKLSTQRSFSCLYHRSITGTLTYLHQDVDKVCKILTEFLVLFRAFSYGHAVPEGSFQLESKLAYRYDIA